MKKISEHLGEIIIALAGVALLITAITLFKAPIGDFFENIVDKEVDVGNKVLGDINVGDMNFFGPDGGLVLEAGAVIPEGGIYYVNAATDEDGTEFLDYSRATATYTAGQNMPSSVNVGDVFVYGDYAYGYNCVYSYVDDCWWQGTYVGWGVRVLDEGQTEFGTILESINGQPIVDLSCTFEGCSGMEIAPAIPSGVENLFRTFAGCYSLTTAPIIPEGVVEMEKTFYYCEQLESAELPSSVDYISGTFFCCGSLMNVTLPSGVRIIYDDTFYGTCLEEIHFSGTMAQWEAIDKESGWEYVLALNIYCTDGIVQV